MRLVLDTKGNYQNVIFAGFGIQYRWEQITIYEKKNGSCTWDPSELYVQDPPKIEIHKNWYPTLNIGILICMPFN